ncbi:hypothetical protein L228DRAFT_86005 [Xylona heveae TC161]|uniref:Altered inheritance of mitochondria protein 9, mitochondrial n=1 Tax=Xylona heveae (strain CBS 132557 / TC161) TaxID=1328760 RepID=A0A165HVE7_XYLHT|nr:hypothetical protein L228DRAFT_86005 [Xylona heveae TC161]KZF23975.1 hypothetical protein L228DRAFT_86005 [Xylona heveae TC161]
MLRIFRGLKKLRPGQKIAPISILCRGESVNREALFAYANGRFLVDEQLQFDRRFLKFNVDALCDVVAATDVEPSPIAAIEKREGGFSKALLMKKKNGKEVLAKLPLPLAGPPSLATASEVGVLEYVRKHTNIPVPRVLSWSSDRSNPVGSEYIIMEKAAGIPLFQQWGVMKEFEKLELIKNLTRLEAQLSGISFPSYGSLYLRGSARHSKHHILDESIDPSNSFCIGPSCDRSFDSNTTSNLTLPRQSFDSGPWNTISSFGTAIAKRELSRLTTGRLNRQPIFYHGTMEEQTQLLKFTTDIMQMLDLHPILRQVSQPTLWHTDLHMGNIFVAPDDPSQIVSLIDFQSISVLPLFLQAQWPIFVKPPQNYVKGLVHPKLPDDFDDLDNESKTIALQEWSQAKLAKAYEVSNYLENRLAHNAMNIPRVFRELFIRCGEISDVGVLPLRECLIEIYQNWSNLGFTRQCPFKFSAEEISLHEQQFAEYQSWHDVQTMAQECLDTDAEGWIAPQIDIMKKKRQNKELLSLYIEHMAGEKSPEEVKKMWPFLDDT